MTQISAIQTMKRELGLDEDDYRGLLQRVTGKASLRAMSTGELGKVIEDMRAKGASKTKQLAGPYGSKLQALWISGWNLGVVRNRDDAALLAFVKAQTGIEHTRFLRNSADARKAVEALKQWLARAAGVDWSEFTDPQDCVIAAQIRLLRLQSGDGLYRATRLARMQELGARIRAQGARNG